VARAPLCPVPTIVKVRVQCLLAAAAKNIKKIALALTKAPQTAAA
ncbi:transposase-related protein, partial [Nitratireductor aquibiodomus RA22]